MKRLHAPKILFQKSSNLSRKFAFSAKNCYPDLCYQS